MEVSDYNNYTWAMLALYMCVNWNISRPSYGLVMSLPLTEMASCIIVEMFGIKWPMLAYTCALIGISRFLYELACYFCYH